MTGSPLEVSPGAALALNAFRAAIQDVFASKAIDVNAQREQYIDALAEVGELLYRIGASEAGSKINLLAEMLGDLQHGAVHKILLPVQQVRGSLSLSQDFRGRAYAALAVEALVQGSQSGPEGIAKLTRRDAAKHLADRHPELSRFMSKDKQNLARAIFDWDRQYRAGQMKNPEIYKLYETYFPKIVSGVKGIPEYRRKEGSEEIASALVAEALTRCN